MRHTRLRVYDTPNSIVVTIGKNQSLWRDKGSEKWVYQVIKNNNNFDQIFRELLVFDNMAESV